MTLRFIILVLIIFNISVLRLEAQPTNRKPLSYSWEEWPCIHCCLDNLPLTEQYFRKDSILSLFFNYIKNGDDDSLKLRGDAFLQSVMSRAKNNYSLTCILPILTIIDKEAPSIYKNSCVIQTKRILNKKAYCNVLTISESILFYLEFVAFRKYKLPVGYSFDNIKIIKKGAGVDYELSAEDINSIYTFYDQTLLTKKKIKRPLKGTKYKWLIEISKT